MARLSLGCAHCPTKIAKRRMRVKIFPLNDFALRWKSENRRRSGAEHDACRQNGAVIAFF